MSATATPAVKATEVKKPEVRDITTSVRDGEEILIVNSQVLNLINKAFDIQDDVENQSKFIRGFVFDATNAYAKAYCNRVISVWDRLIDKASKLHPTQTREQVTLDVLASRKAQELKRFADAAKELQKQLR